MATVESLRMYQINILDYAKIEKIEKNLNNYGIVFDNIENYAIMVNMQDSDFSYKEKAVKAKKNNPRIKIKWLFFSTMDFNNTFEGKREVLKKYIEKLIILDKI